MRKNVMIRQNNTINRNAFVLFAGLTILMLWTSCLLPLTWDEPNAILRSEKIGKWVSFFWNCPAEISSPFDWDVIQKYCEQTTQIEGHPAGYVLLNAAGQGLAHAVNLPAICDEKTCWRLGSILLFCIAIAAVYVRVGHAFGQSSAVFCALCILFLPRVFAHAHIAACDSPLLSCWLLAWAFFEPALKSKRGAILWGLAIGLGFSMKFPGWMIPIPYLAYATIELCRRRPMGAIIRSFLIGFPIAVFLFYLLNPTLWYAPIEGFLEFVRLNTHREHLNVALLFFNRIYDLHHHLPWYNTLVWAGITIPTGLLFFLLCFVAGRLRVFKTGVCNTLEQNRLMLLAILNFLPLMIVRAIPGMPVHDGVRLFVAAFPFAGILAGLGAANLWGSDLLTGVKCITTEEKSDSGDSGNPSMDIAEVNGKMEMESKELRPRFLLLRRALVILLLFGAGFNLFWYGPQWLSYYNLCIGGLPGAARAGLEVTYYWDALDNKTLNWLNEHTNKDPDSGKQEVILFCNFENENLKLLNQWNKLPPSVYRPHIEPKTDKWFVLQYRGVFPDRVNDLIETCQPAYRKVIPRRGPGPWNLCEVPLLDVYSIEDLIHVMEKSQDSGNPSPPGEHGLKASSNHEDN